MDLLAVLLFLLDLILPFQPEKLGKRATGDPSHDKIQT